MTGEIPAPSDNQQIFNNLEQIRKEIVEIRHQITQ